MFFSMLDYFGPPCDGGDINPLFFFGIREAHFFVDLQDPDTGRVGFVKPIGHKYDL